MDLFSMFLREWFLVVFTLTLCPKRVRKVIFQTVFRCAHGCHGSQHSEPSCSDTGQFQCTLRTNQRATNTPIQTALKARSTPAHTLSEPDSTHKIEHGWPMSLGFSCLHTPNTSNRARERRCWSSTFFGYSNATSPSRTEHVAMTAELYTRCQGIRTVQKLNTMDQKLLKFQFYFGDLNHIFMHLPTHMHKTIMSKSLSGRIRQQNSMSTISSLMILH